MKTRRIAPPLFAVAMLSAFACSSSKDVTGVADQALSAAVCADATAWAAGVAYATGAAVTYNGELYGCVQGHTSQSDWTPAATPALWSA